MSLADTLLAEFDTEMATTRKLLARIPPDKLDWRPHPRSTTMGGLGRHLAHMVAWARVALPNSTFDIASRQPMPPTASPAEILSIFDDNIKATRELISGKSDEELNAKWVLTAGGRSVIEMSKAAVVSSMVVHHMIDHRGQLSVYLRLNDIPVPSMYGPSADEPM